MSNLANRNVGAEHHEQYDGFESEKLCVSEGRWSLHSVCAIIQSSTREEISLFQYSHNA